jgi:hypothetical protein
MKRLDAVCGAWACTIPLRAPADHANVCLDRAKLGNDGTNPTSRGEPWASSAPSQTRSASAPRLAGPSSLAISESAPGKRPRARDGRSTSGEGRNRRAKRPNTAHGATQGHTGTATSTRTRTPALAEVITARRRARRRARPSLPGSVLALTGQAAFSPALSTGQDRSRQAARSGPGPPAAPATWTPCRRLPR